MFTPFENYVGDDGRFSQTSNASTPPPRIRDMLNPPGPIKDAPISDQPIPAAAYTRRLEEKLAAAKKELAELKAETPEDGKRPRKIEIAQRYARMLEEASLTVVGAEGRAVVKEALEHYCRYLEG